MAECKNKPRYFLIILIPGRKTAAQRVHYFMTSWPDLFQSWLKREAFAIPAAGAPSLPLAEAELLPVELLRLLAGTPGRLLLVTDENSAAERLLAALETFRPYTGETRPLLLLPPAGDPKKRQWLPEYEAARDAALDTALRGEPVIFVACAAALLAPTPPPRQFAKQTLELAAGEAGWAPDTLAAALTELDYDNEIEVHVPGEFARRGGILDLFSPLYGDPVRLEFFGDEIESIRFFRADTQLSTKPVERIRIPPRGASPLRRTAAATGSAATFLDYLGREVPLVVCEPGKITDHLTRFTDETVPAAWKKVLAGPNPKFIFDDGVETGRPEVEARAGDGGTEAEGLQGRQGLQGRTGRETRPGASTNFRSSLLPFSPLSPLSPANVPLSLAAELAAWQAQGYQVVAFCGTRGDAERLPQLLAEGVRDERTTVEGPQGPQGLQGQKGQEGRDTSSSPWSPLRPWSPSPVPPSLLAVEPVPLAAGFVIPGARLVFLSERELFGRHAAARPVKASPYRLENMLRDGLDLEEGAHAVHAAHGICVCHGIREVETGGRLQEALELEFAEDARLFVPLDQIHLVGRYVGSGKKLPNLSRIGGAAWKHAKSAAADAALDFAAELLRIAAVREQAPGVTFREEPAWERLFAASFPYTETPDQARAIREVLADMGQPRPMDRLLCGDVGYGKTEVAIRAAFRAVMNGKQAAVLVPTTVLAQQHYRTFRERMAEYPVRIESISRFRSKSEQTAILKAAARGEVDILIGTHRLIQPDVKFASLGLLVIDEEQRFGVEHKEKLKAMRAEVDILTMTATPIPRTLHFSLAGLRSLSTISSPPVDRLPITTAVCQFDDDVIREAILRELDRKGQIFFLHNRVQTIEAFAARIRRLVPEARYAVAHGQMPAEELEEVMTRFVDGGVDVLVSTTIIESGLDIPNANTILIDHAERFGLAELYQLRGRVGRYHNQAYAYFLIPPASVLPANAKQRLAAIRRYTQLGAGFKLAMRDLEIRGSGNLLGAQQSGHIAAVGFDLYCQLLREAVAKLGHQPSPTPRTELPVALESVCVALHDQLGRQTAAIPPEYIGAESVRIELYRRINTLMDAALADALEAELSDRFGPPPDPVLALLELRRVRLLARQLGLTAVSVRNQEVFLETEHGLLRDPRRQLYRLKNTVGLPQLRELRTLISGLAKAQVRKTG